MLECAKIGFHRTHELLGKTFCDDMKKTVRSILPLLGLIVLGTVAYINALPNGFHFDDYEAIVNNPAIRDLKHLPSYFTDTRTWTMSSQQDWRPLVLTTFALNYWMGGLNPVYFHSTNLALHIGVAFFTFLIFKNIAARSAARLRELSEKTAGRLGLIASLVFLVHPANSEVVNYVFARSTLMATFFSVAAFYAYLRGPFSGKEAYSRLWHPAAVLLIVMAVGSKGSAVILPVSLIVFEVIFLNPLGQSPWRLFRDDPRRLRKYLPFALFGVAYLALRPSFVRRLFVGIFTGAKTESAFAYLYTQFRAWVYYLSQFFWPDRLVLDYPGFGLSRSLWEAKVLLSLALVLCILAIAWKVWKTAPIVSFFILWYFIMLLPEAGFIPLTNLISGYRPYPSNLGLSIVLVIVFYQAISWLCTKSTGAIRRGLRATLCAGTTVVVVCALTVATLMRNEVWRDDGTLWRDVLSKDPTNSRAYMNLGLHLLWNGKYKQAEALIEKAVRMTPAEASSYLFRALLYSAISRDSAALEDLNRAIELDAKHLLAYYYRGELYRKMGDHEKALADYHSALGLRPLYTDALYGIAQVLMDRGEDEQAKETCERILRIDGGDARAYSCVGKYFVLRKKLDEALAAYRKGTAHAPKSAGLWFELGEVYEKREMYKEAGEAFGQAGSLLNASTRERAQ